MSYFKTFTILFTLVLVIAASTFLLTKNETQKIVAITQMIEEPSLNAVREATIAYLAQVGYVDGKNIKIIYQNAHGNAATSAQIATQMVSMQPDLLIAITTHASQSMMSARGEAKIPFVFSAVTDPMGAKLVPNLDHPGLGISGVMDKLDAKQQLLMLRQFMPNLKTVGVMYNPGLICSTISLQELTIAAKELGINVIPASVNSTKDVPETAHSLIGKVEAIYIPNDTVVAPGLPSILQVGIAHKIPVFAADVGLVKNGAIAAAAMDPVQKGNLTGKIALDFLEHGYNQEIAVIAKAPVELYVNPIAAKNMGLTMPKDLNDKVHIVGGTA